MIIAGSILKRLVGQIRGDQIFSENAEFSNEGTKARRGRGGKLENEMTSSCDSWLRETLV